MLMWVDLINVCAASGSGELTPVIGMLRVFRCVRIVLHVQTFRRMFNATYRVIPAIAPQMMLFILFYYGFAQVGMALFAGCVTEVEANGGPGYWGTEPWASTQFGGARYYYNLNFDNMYSAMVTLFMLMIQNNWQVTVDGYVQCTKTRNARLFFFLFNVTVAQVMINIFVGIVLDMFAVFWEDEQSEGSEEITSLYEILIHRLNTSHTHAGELLSDKWVLDRKVTSEVVYSGIKPSDAMMLSSEASTSVENAGIRDIVHSMPIPVYCRTSANKIAYCNTVFAGLYDKSPQELIGSYLNILVMANEELVERDLQWNKLALEAQGAVEYTEEGVLLDGTQVIFNCTEQPVTLPNFSNTTVIYMNPTDMSGKALMDRDGDGRLASDDMAPAMKTKQKRNTTSDRLTEANPISSTVTF